jgi:lipopolysaccharide transport system ATP-binding protein
LSVELLHYLRIEYDYEKKVNFFDAPLELITMTEKIAIRVDHLGKKYKLGGHQERYHTIRDTIVNSFKFPLKALNTKTPDQEFWALKDISFTVMQGEVIGIIGRNGAGKSTLLKILSRITMPSVGVVDVHGRVGSLLEVGTGFHPELTGRENIFLNGSILGMKKNEIENKFDEIVKFSEIEKFLDTPVKRYSSGMYVRLAFAVAAHLEPEILVVDEVLAVGDAAFQTKCLGKMGEVAKEGRTVLFVSHNMAAISEICQRAILLEGGLISKDNTAKAVVDLYLEGLSDSKTHADLSNVESRQGSGKLRFSNVWIERGDGEQVHVVKSGSRIVFCANFELFIDPKEISDLMVSFTIRSTRGVSITDLNNKVNYFKFGPTFPNHGLIKCVIPKLPLNKGKYQIGIYAEINGIISDWVQEILLLQVESGTYFNQGTELNELYPFFIDHCWSIKDTNLNDRKLKNE